METVDQLLQGMLSLPLRFIDEYFSLFAASTKFRPVYLGHERTAVTSETSENTIFVRFYVALCHLMLTLQIAN